MDEATLFGIRPGEAVEEAVADAIGEDQGAEETQTIEEALIDMREALVVVKETISICHGQSHGFMDTVAESTEAYPAESVEDFRGAAFAMIRAAGKMTQLHEALVSAGAHIGTAIRTIESVVGTDEGEERDPDVPDSIYEKLDEILGALGRDGMIDGYEVIHPSEMSDEDKAAFLKAIGRD